MSLEEHNFYQKHSPERGDRYMIAKKEVPDGDFRRNMCCICVIEIAKDKMPG
jgi:hypothetical protein